MVKRHRFRRHPVHAYRGLMLGTPEEYGAIIQLETLDAAVLAAVDQDDTSWSLLSLRDYSGFGVLPPAAAIAAILDVQVYDSGSSGEDCHMQIAKAGIIVAGRTHYIPAPHVNDMVGSKIVIVELTDDYKFAYMLQASGTNFDYNINLIGWILEARPPIPAWVARDAMPSEDLFCKFVVNQ